MKTHTLTQAEKQHNVNVLHDAFNVAGIAPLGVESIETESRFAFDDSVADAAIQQVITSYVFVASSPSPNIRDLAQSFRNAVTSATTVPQLKNALNQELMLLIRQLAQRDVRDL